MKQILNNFFATLRRYKVSSTLNIVGFGVAFASLYFIGVQLSYDLTFNRDIVDYKQIYRLDAPYPNKMRGGLFITMVSRPVGIAIGDQIPQVESYCSITAYANPNNILTRESGERVELNTPIINASDGVVELLSMEIVTGDIEQFYLPDGQNIIISESLAKQYEIVVGDKIDNISTSQHYTVAAIYKDLPLRSQFAGIKMLQNMGDRDIDDIRVSFTTFYYKLQKDADLAQKEATARKITQQVNSALGAEDSSAEKCAVRFLPLKDTHFAKDVMTGYNSADSANWDNIYVLILIAAVILVIAFVNFINFFFALVPIRIRAVNARKIFGASRAELLWGFIVEALGLFLLSFTWTMIIVLSMQDGFVAEYFSTSVLLADNLDLALGLALLGVVVSIGVALYPALFITSFPTQMVISKGFAASRKGQILRNGLIGVQFISSMILFTVAIFMQSQYNYMLNYDLGIDIEDRYNTRLGWLFRSDPAVSDGFDKKLRECRDIESFTYISSMMPSKMGSSTTIEVDSVVIICNILSAELSALEFFDIEFVEGGDLFNGDKAQIDNVFVINETAKRILGKDDRYMEVGKGSEFVGVVKDFNFSSLNSEIQPLYIFFNQDTSFTPSVLCYHIRQGASLREVESYIKASLEEFDADFPTQYMEFTSLRDQVVAMYGNERKQSRMILIFTLVSIVISLMGVFGLVLFETQFRQQEIVIRRVHGATVGEILMMINRKFLFIIGVCFLVAAPVSYFVAHRWLATFAYHISVSAWVFVVVLVVVTLVTISIVTVQSLKAANSNPADLIGKNS